MTRKERVIIIAAYVGILCLVTLLALGAFGVFDAPKTVSKEQASATAQVGADAPARADERAGEHILVNFADLQNCYALEQLINGGKIFNPKITMDFSAHNVQIELSGITEQFTSQLTIYYYDIPYTDWTEADSRGQTFNKRQICYDLQRGTQPASIKILSYDLSHGGAQSAGPGFSIPGKYMSNPVGSFVLVFTREIYSSGGSSRQVCVKELNMREALAATYNTDGNYTDGYGAGKVDGYKQGQNDGLTAGTEQGRTEGYASGKADAIAENEKAVSDAVEGLRLKDHVSTAGGRWTLALLVVSAVALLALIALGAWTLWRDVSARPFIGGSKNAGKK